MSPLTPTIADARREEGRRPPLPPLGPLAH